MTLNEIKKVRTVVESLKRLYESGKISKEVVKGRVVKGTINEDEYKYITGEDYEA